MEVSNKKRKELRKREIEKERETGEKTEDIGQRLRALDK